MVVVLSGGCIEWWSVEESSYVRHECLSMGVLGDC